MSSVGQTLLILIQPQAHLKILSVRFLLTKHIARKKKGIFVLQKLMGEY